MKERPILFSGPMVRALLSGAKTQTRRVMKPQPAPWVEFVREHAPDVYGPGALCAFRADGKTHQRMPPSPYGQPGDRLWVKETWRPRISHSCGMDACDCDSVWIDYLAGGEGAHFYGDKIPEHWLMPKAAARGNVSPLSMPRWASRIALEITGVRVERLNEISEADAKAEGANKDCPIGHLPAYLAGPYVYSFAQVWESINGPGSWAANPWVWVIEFQVIEGGGNG